MIYSILKQYVTLFMQVHVFASICVEEEIWLFQSFRVEAIAFPITPIRLGLLPDQIAWWSGLDNQALIYGSEPFRSTNLAPWKKLGCISHRGQCRLDSNGFGDKQDFMTNKGAQIRVAKLRRICWEIFNPKWRGGHPPSFVTPIRFSFDHLKKDYFDGKLVFFYHSNRIYTPNLRGFGYQKTKK